MVKGIEAAVAKLRVDPEHPKARRFGTLKAELRRRGTPKSDFDLSIAAIAFDLEAILVSDDRAFHEDPIPGLAVENWLLG